MKEENKNDNSAVELQNIMFAQMKRLSDPNANLDIEIKRGQALSAAGTVIINAAKVQIDAKRVALLHQKNNETKESKPKQLNNGK